MRAQLVVAGVVCVILIAVPLYLLRRPSSASATAVVASASASAPRLAPAPIAVDAGAPPPVKPAERVRLAPAQRVKCGTSATQARVEGGLCDSMPPIEQALGNAIRASVDCAPKRKEEGSINYVLNIDFNQRKFHVFPGASGSWRGPAARKAAECVNRAFANPDWGAVPHQYRYYWVAILATYPLPSAVAAPPGTPTFE
ncbi:MAG TPA: hypothetical protein VMI54_13745 [Polyangiaceae bacterium]|nr:hypothetical protein [Polyangiaceae bacterium]